MAVEWSVQPGTRLKRTDLHDIYGGGRRGGMEPSAVSPNVLLFTSPKVGPKHGYTFDSWNVDGTYFYTGEGRFGDQVMTNGNRATRDHMLAGRALRLFESDGTDVTYMGEFEVPNDGHVLLDEARDANGEPRTVFVFRLKPVGPVWTNPELPEPVSTPDVRTVALEAFNLERYVTERQSIEPGVGLRTEAALVSRYAKKLIKSGLALERHSILTPAGRSMLTDIWVPQPMELIEAKASSSRTHLRTALGQILDYGRYVTHSSLAVLTPTRPEIDMEHLLLDHGVGLIWETDKKGIFEARRVHNEWST